MENMISRAEYDEFRKRMDEGNHRKNRWIELFDRNMNQFSVLMKKIRFPPY